MTTTTRRATALVATGLLAAGIATAPASAQPSSITAPRTQVTTQERPWSLFYDDIVTGTGGNTLILYTGASVEEHCVDDYPTATERGRTRAGRDRSRPRPPADRRSVPWRLRCAGRHGCQQRGGGRAHPEGQRWVVRGAAKLTLSPEFSVDHVSFEVRNAR